jgi:hypothetical protein
MERYDDWSPDACRHGVSFDHVHNDGELGWMPGSECPKCLADWKAMSEENRQTLRRYRVVGQMLAFVAQCRVENKDEALKILTVHVNPAWWASESEKCGSEEKLLDMIGAMGLRVHINPDRLRTLGHYSVITKPGQ